MSNISHTIKRGGRKIFVPRGVSLIREGNSYRVDDEKAERRTDALIQSIWNKWSPPLYMYHFRPRGMSRPLRFTWRRKFFAKIDLTDFYGSVTRTKVHRPLKTIGFSNSAAFKIAGESTVKHGSRVCLPMGFRQSPVLASVTLDTSLCGSILRRNELHSNISIFMDDILLSDDDEDALAESYIQARSALAMSGFEVNLQKSSGPSKHVECFNILMSRNGLRFTDERRARFAREGIAFINTLRKDNKEALYRKCYGNYIESINKMQGQFIEMIVLGADKR
jgi:hypothetical protein